MELSYEVTMPGLGRICANIPPVAELVDGVVLCANGYNSRT